MKGTTSVSRETKETSVKLTLNLDGSGIDTVNTGVGFFDHLLESFAHHAMFHLKVETTGDLRVDEHHTVEDTALALGTVLADAAGADQGELADEPADLLCHLLGVVAERGESPAGVLDFLDRRS